MSHPFVSIFVSILGKLVRFFEPLTAAGYLKLLELGRTPHHPAR
jgi:hypothetical protein